MRGQWSRLAGVIDARAARNDFDQVIRKQTVHDAIDVKGIVFAVVRQLMERPHAVDQEEDLPLVRSEGDLFVLRLRYGAVHDRVVGKELQALLPLFDAPRPFHDQVGEIHPDRDRVRRQRRLLYERELPPTPDEAVVHDLRDLHFEVIPELGFSERPLLHGELPELAAIALHEAVDAVPLLAGDPFLAKQDRPETELLLIRAGVNERALIEKEVGLFVVVCDRQRPAFSRGAQKREHLREAERGQGTLQYRLGHGRADCTRAQTTIARTAHKPAAKMAIHNNRPRISGRIPTAARLCRESCDPIRKSVTVSPIRAARTIASQTSAGASIYVRAIDARRKNRMNQGRATRVFPRRN